jgi:hypothetical protein
MWLPSLHEYTAPYPPKAPIHRSQSSPFSASVSSCIFLLGSRGPRSNRAGLAFVCPGLSEDAEPLFAACGASASRLASVGGRGRFSKEAPHANSAATKVAGTIVLIARKNMALRMMPDSMRSATLIRVWTSRSCSRHVPSGRRRNTWWVGVRDALGPPCDESMAPSRSPSVPPPGFPVAFAVARARSFAETRARDS